MTKVTTIKSPLLVLHGDRDEIVPFRQGKKVFDPAPQPKAFYTIIGASHNDTVLVGGDLYFKALRKHIESGRIEPTNKAISATLMALVHSSARTRTHF